MSSDDRTKFIRRFFKNRWNREAEEHEILRLVPSHVRGEMKKILKQMVVTKQLKQRKKKATTLYKIKK